MTDLSKPLHHSYPFKSLFLSKLLDLKHSLCISLHGIRAEILYNGTNHKFCPKHFQSHTSSLTIAAAQ